jgi:predicted alpha-1,2-mannosidase
MKKTCLINTKEDEKEIAGQARHDRPLHIKNIYLLILLFTAVAQANVASPKEPIDYVSTLVGTMSTGGLSHGNTYPAIAMPWGMNFWTPQTGPMGDGWMYVYTANKIRGFKQTHQPSPWINDYGQFSLMPVTGELVFDEEKRASWFSHKTEIAQPHYYRVYLADYDVVTEITPTERAAMFRFTFPENEHSYIVIDAFNKGSSVQIIPEENKIIGYTTRNSGGVARNFKNYFVIVFDKSFTFKSTVDNGNINIDKLEVEADHAGAIIGFSTKRGELVHAKVASSFISQEQAQLNLKELGDKIFDEVKADGRKIWNDVLGRLEVNDDNTDNLRTFYSCLYRSTLFPRSLFEYDATGKVVHYSPNNGQVLSGYYFTDTGFWDTFRCLFPFVNLIYPSMSEKMQEGLLNVYLESGFFPEWASPGHRGCMVGNNSASVVADAFLKGITKVDANKMYEGMLYGANHVHPRASSTGRLGFEYYNDLGYVPYDVKINESVARTLEYAYDDWCIYQMGKKLGRPAEELELYKKRSLNYKNVFDKESKLMRGKNADGTFQTPFNPFKWGDAFTEGNSWHYSWSVFHDVQGLIDLMGGEKMFVSMLDSVFNLPPVFDESYYGRVIHEIREMQIMNMGNYAHGNQPIQHAIYLYNYAKEPWKAQYWLRETMDKLYSANPDGYCGDEDNGQTSAWYVFSALGFYPVCPASDEYILGSPLFKQAKIHFENGKIFEINAPSNNEKTRYIKKILYNGKEYSPNYLKYTTLLQGGKMQVEMSETPNLKRGINAGDVPYSLSRK